MHCETSPGKHRASERIREREEREPVSTCRSSPLSVKIGILLGHFAQVLLISISVLYIIVISALVCSKEIRKQAVFLNWFNVPLFANFSAPQIYGLRNTDNIYLSGEAGKIGSWYVKPLRKKQNEPPFHFLYLHGNGGNRAVKHRVELLKKLQDDGNFVLAVDYRGYADSDGKPSEEGLVSDALIAWQYLTERAGPDPLYIWGHSLGSGVAVGLGKRLARDARLRGVILEAPFNNVRDAALRHPLAVILKMIPEDWVLHYLIQEQALLFPSDKQIEELTCPILIVHDKSDEIIPMELGEELCNVAKISKRNVTCAFFDEKLYHKFIYRSENFFEKLRSFLRDTSAMFEGSV